MATVVRLFVNGVLEATFRYAEVTIVERDFTRASDSIDELRVAFQEKIPSLPVRNVPHPRDLAARPRAPTLAPRVRRPTTRRGH